MILANKEAAEKFNFNKAIFPGTQGGPLEHVIAAKAVCLGEALKPEFKEYAASGSIRMQKHWQMHCRSRALRSLQAAQTTI